MKKTIVGWGARGLLLATMTASAGVSTPALAVECDGGLGPFTCAQGTSVANFDGFLERPAEGDAFFHIQIDMKGGQLIALAFPVDSAGNVLQQFMVVDKDPSADQFEPATSDSLFGRGGDVLVDEVEDFQWPLDIVSIHVNVI